MSDVSRPAEAGLPKSLQPLAWLTALPVGLIVVLTFVDVLGRYVFASPVKGSIELIEYAMAMLIFTALPLVTHQRGHVSVSLIDGWFKGAGKRLKEVLCDMVSLAALGLMTWRLAVHGLDELAAGGSTVVLNLPQAPLTFAMAALSALSSLMVAGLIIGNLRRLSDEGDAA